MAKLGFVGLGVMGGGVARRLLAAGHELHGWNRTPEKAAPLVAEGLVLEDSPSGRCRAGGRRLHDGHERSRAPCGRRRRGWDHRRSRPGQGMGGHDDGRPGSVPRACRTGPRDGRRHGRRPRVGKRVDARGRPALDHGRRERGDVRPCRADPSRHRAEGDPRRRQRAGAALEDRHQPEPARADGRLLRGPAAGREGWDRPRGRPRRDARKRHRLADAEVPGTVHPRHAGRGLVQRQHDAEGHAARPRGGPPARRADADDGDHERAPDGGRAPWDSNTTTSPSSTRCSPRWPA